MRWHQTKTKMVMKKWDVDLCFGKSLVRINKFQVNLPFSDRDVPMVNIIDVTPQQIHDQWSDIPEHYKISDTFQPIAEGYPNSSQSKKKSRVSFAGITQQ